MHAQVTQSADKYMYDAYRSNIFELGGQITLWQAPPSDLPLRRPDVALLASSEEGDIAHDANISTLLDSPGLQRVYQLVDSHSRRHHCRWYSSLRRSHYRWLGFLVGPQCIPFLETIFSPSPVMHRRCRSLRRQELWWKDLFYSPCCVLCAWLLLLMHLWSCGVTELLYILELQIGSKEGWTINIVWCFVVVLTRSYGLNY
jgi:hypothetical protein